ncbi:MAG TPA: hypothetical protein VF658_09165 [Pyrinomonadaceae bacterium]|jgi:hypothetical protein
MTSERLPLSDEDIKEARKQFENFIRMMTAAGKKLASDTSATNSSSESRNNDYYMEVTLTDGREMKLKTIFHAVEKSIEDRHGGVFKCTYHMRNTVNGLFEWLLGHYPRASVNEIQAIADERKISFDEAKKSIALHIAEREFWIRLSMARFLHEQLEPALKIMLTDLVEDAGLYGLSHYGIKLVNPKDIDRVSKGYIRLRKKRTNIIEGVGKRGKAAVSAEEVIEFMETVFAEMRELEKAGRKITPNAVARKIISYNHSNPLKAFKDRLNKYDITFDDLKNEYLRIESEQKNR